MAAAEVEEEEGAVEKVAKGRPALDASPWLSLPQQEPH